jgi:hypothetical protein
MPRSSTLCGKSPRQVSLSREDGARKDILELCTHNPRRSGSSIDVYPVEGEGSGRPCRPWPWDPMILHQSWVAENGHLGQVEERGQWTEQVL